MVFNCKSERGMASVSSVRNEKVVDFCRYSSLTVYTGNMLPPVTLFLLLVSSDAATVDVPTFGYEDPDTGETLSCTLCSPGTYVFLPCTRTLDTVCLPCPEQHFTEFWNFLPKCLYCSNVCEGTRVVKEQCSARHNRVCECKEGHYQQDHFCIRHTQCPPGMGAKTIGNTHRNTECERCPRGMFSAKTSTSTQCINHTDCGTLQVLFPGRAWHDNVCASCASLISGKGLKALRDILPRFFSYRNVKLRKLQKFVASFNKMYRHKRQVVKPRALLLDLIREWTAKAPAYHLKSLPKILQRVGLYSTAGKVQEMLRRLEETASTCRNL